MSAANTRSSSNPMDTAGTTLEVSTICSSVRHRLRRSWQGKSSGLSACRLDEHAFTAAQIDRPRDLSPCLSRNVDRSGLSHPSRRPRRRALMVRALQCTRYLLGKLDGWEVARAAREIDPRFPIIYMTSVATDWASQGVPNSILFSRSSTARAGSRRTSCRSPSNGERSGTAKTRSFLSVPPLVI
jgi:hypothetical protein